MTKTLEEIKKDAYLWILNADIGPNGNTYCGVDEGMVFSERYMNKLLDQAYQAGLLEKIVRCKDCVHYATRDCPYMLLKERRDKERMKDEPFAKVYLGVHHPDGFCAWGKRVD